MPTLSSILALRIPWTEEPGRLQSLGSKRRTPGMELKQQLFLLLQYFYELDLKLGLHLLLGMIS